jgi:hypothetical protein
MRNLFSELKRRNVIRAVILYVGAVWALAQGISQLGTSVGAHGMGDALVSGRCSDRFFRSGSRSPSSTNSRRRA